MSQCKNAALMLLYAKYNFSFLSFDFKGWPEEFLTVFVRFTWLFRANLVVSRSISVKRSAARTVRLGVGHCCFVWYGDDYGWKYSVIISETAISGESVELGNIQMVWHLHCETLIKHSDGFLFLTLWVIMFKQLYCYMF